MVSYKDVFAHVKRLRAASLARGAGDGGPLPPAAVYGFVGFAGSWTALLGYLVWAFAPGRTLPLLVPLYRAMDEVLPSRYWAVAGPVWLFATIAMIPFVYRGVSIALQSPDADLDAMADAEPPSGLVVPEHVPPLQVYSAEG